MSTQLNREERNLWSNMKNALKTHNSYDVRKEYYPLNMESWEKDRNEIEEGYRTQLEEMITSRLEIEAIEAEENARMEAATALIIGGLGWALFAFSGIDHHTLNHELKHHIVDIAEILFFLLGAMTIVELIDAHQGFAIITDKITTNKKVYLIWILSIITFFF